MKVEVFLFLLHPLLQEQALYIIYCNKEVLSICVAIYFFHTYLQFLRKPQMDTLGSIGFGTSISSKVNVTTPQPGKPASETEVQADRRKIP